MSQNTNPLSAATPWNLVADGYSRTTMQMLAQYAEAAIAAVNIQPGSCVLDVACGPGTLALMVARKAAKVHGIDFSEPMLEICRRNAEQSSLNNIETQHGDAQAMPYADNLFDATFSMFGLMFFPDRGKGFAEIYRTLKPGGSIAVTSWAPVSESPAMQMMFGALRVMKPEIPEPEAAVASLENPQVFKQEMQDAGFREVKIDRVRKYFPVETVEAFWSGMVEGSAPIQMLKRSMGEAEWREKEQLALHYLHTCLKSLPTTLASDAWLGTAVK